MKWSEALREARVVKSEAGGDTGDCGPREARPITMGYLTSGSTHANRGPCTSVPDKYPRTPSSGSERSASAPGRRGGARTLQSPTPVHHPIPASAFPGASRIWMARFSLPGPRRH